MTTTKKPAKKAAPKKAAPAKAAVKKAAKSATGTAPRKVATKAPAKATATRKAPAKPRAAAKTTKAVAAPPRAPRTRVKPVVEQDVVARLHEVVKTALDDLKAKDVREIDVRGKTSVTDIVIVASGTSTRHVKSIADEVVRSAKKAGLPPLGVEGQREAEWVLVDLGDIIVHVMLPRTREFYGLERLWTVGDDSPETALAG